MLNDAMNWITELPHIVIYAIIGAVCGGIANGVTRLFSSRVPPSKSVFVVFVVTFALLVLALMIVEPALAQNVTFLIEQ